MRRVDGADGALRPGAAGAAGGGTPPGSSVSSLRLGRFPRFGIEFEGTFLGVEPRVGMKWL